MSNKDNKDEMSEHNFNSMRKLLCALKDVENGKDIKKANVAIVDAIVWLSLYQKIVRPKQFI